MTQPSGFGGERWGSDPWGSSFLPPGARLTLVSAFCPVENVVRLQFDVVPFFSGLLEPDDASSPVHYSFSPVGGSTGRDGLPPRPVTPQFAQVGEDFASIDVFLDRTMSPFPAQYVVSVTGLTDVTNRQPMLPDPQTFRFFGIFKRIEPPNPHAAAPSRDFANPITARAAQLTNPRLGTFVIDDTGDYAIDEGIASLKKRIVRRLFTTTGAFEHLPTYGVGIPKWGKKLASATTRSKIAADAQAQILLEPEVATATVTSQTDAANPGIVRFRVDVQTKTGQAFRASVPVAIT